MPRHDGGDAPPPDRLGRYRAKRDPAKTSEPFGAGGTAAGGRLFVFHKHHARNLHWDLRLEWNGALESWAVPKGPSPNPADKRLAMHVEPHPLDYAEFEGVIPKGEYGAGPSIVWDKGTWVPIEDVEAGFAKGKLLFELHGYKVKGLWTLIHTPRAGENHWLLIKEKDGHVDPRGTESYPDDSIYSGLDVDDLPRASEIEAELKERAIAAGGKAKKVRARDVEAMKATRRDDAFSDPSWVYELKYDGYRLIAGREQGDGVLISRNGNDLTDTFPEVARAVKGLPFDGLVLDGEVVVHDDRGLPDFGLLQKRGLLKNRRDVARAALELPATYYAFDLLALDGVDLRAAPLLARKTLLREVLPTVGAIRFSEHVPEQGEALAESVRRMGLEGIVAKRADSKYEGGRSRSWFKIPGLRTEDFVVVGFTDPNTGRAGFGSLWLGRYVGDELRFVGGVGTGFSTAVLGSLRKRLDALEDPKARAGVKGEVPTPKTTHWVRPELVVEVTFKEITSGGMVRHASFMRVRDDKRPEECRDAEEELSARRAELPEPKTEKAPDRVVKISNPQKVFWPRPGYTKGDLIEYYRAISPWLLPYLADRPLVLTRYPDGVDGKSFYQKDAPSWTPEWIRTVTVRSDSSEKKLNYFVADDLETLLYVANLGAIPLHIWHSRVPSLDRPDWCLIDLDPKDAPFEHVVEIALFLHELLGEVKLPHYIKTSGSSGLHILIPLGGQMDYDQCVTLGELIARITVQALPKISTVERVVKKRAGKVYLDYLQNRQGQLVAAPFSAREKPGATVSAPLLWKEVGPKLSLADYTIASVPERMKAMRGKDPLAPVLDERPDLIVGLEGLMKRKEKVAGTPAKARKR